MMKPAKVRATAPVTKLSMLEVFGRAELEAALLLGLPSASPSFAVFVAFFLATAAAAPRFVRRELRALKYKAEPKPVRSALGTVPRQNWRIGEGPDAISRIVAARVVERDCCTRVLRRSAGWRRKAVVQPEPRPARKWKAVVRRVSV